MVHSGMSLTTRMGVALSGLLFASTCNAAMITGATTASTSGWTLDNVTVAGTLVTLDMTVTDLHVPFVVDFAVTTVDATGGPAITIAHTIVVNVTNGLTYGNPAHSANLNGYDVVVTDTGAVGGAGIPGIPLPNLGAFGFTYPTAPFTNITGGWRFGGLNGGGGTLAVGAMTTTSFALNTTTSGGFAAGFNDTVGLTFTANPEPTTMLLGGLALLPCGIAVRRRRQRLQQSVDATTPIC